MNQEIVSHWFTQVKPVTDGIKKPLIVGETGSVSGPRDANRATVLKQKIDQYHAAGAAGVLIWNWMPEWPSWSEATNHWILPDDPFMDYLRTYNMA